MTHFHPARGIQISQVPSRQECNALEFAWPRRREEGRNREQNLNVLKETWGVSTSNESIERINNSISLSVIIITLDRTAVVHISIFFISI